jgi:hypothetical protein
MQRLAEFRDLVEVVRSLVAEVDSLQQIGAGQEACLQVLERLTAPRLLPQVDDLAAEPGASKPTGRVKKV